MTNFYTRTGDDGTSGLLGDQRVSKNHPRLEAVGSIDEANSALGLARSFLSNPEQQAMIITIQRDLYNLMAEAAATKENAENFRVIDGSRITWLENQIDQYGNLVEYPKEFIIPGDSRAGAAFDLARTIVRRAERRVATIIHQGVLENMDCLRYLNRLSSLCFILEVWVTSTLNDSPLTLSKE